MKKELMFSISCPEKRLRERKRWRKESRAMNLLLPLKFLEVSCWFLWPVVLFPLQRKDEICCLVGTDIMTNEGNQSIAL